jgi:hypothetical protein
VEFNVEPVPGGRPPAAADAPADYAKHMALSGKRLDCAYMKAVFERHKDVEGGLSKAALMAALREVEAPVLSSSDGASEDSVFHRADTNSSNYVDLDECASFARLHARVCCARGNAVVRRFVLVANLPDDLEMFLADHKLGVSAARRMSAAALQSRAVCCSLLRRCSGLMLAAGSTSWAALRR